jgi:hypothetical protein
MLGFTSHLRCCPKKNSFEECVMLKMACKICGRAMLPASLKVHMSTIHKNPPKVKTPHHAGRNRSALQNEKGCSH